jgi:hypothetical protein
MAPENEIEQALDLLVQDIFMTYSGNQEEMSYEEWKRWFTSLDGVAEVLAGKSSKDNSQSKMENTASVDGSVADKI